MFFNELAYYNNQMTDVLSRKIPRVIIKKTRLKRLYRSGPALARDMAFMLKLSGVL